MNKKAFTLVELLAVIVILGIILLIAIPSVTKIVTEAKKDTLVSSAKLIAKTTLADSNLNGTDEYKLDTDGKLWRKEKDDSYTQIKYNGKIIGYNTDVIIVININNIIINGIVCEGSSNWCLNGGTTLNNVTDDDVVAVADSTIYPTVPDDCFTYTTTDNEITITDYTVSSTCKTSLSIPSSIGGVPVTIIGTDAFRSKNITTVDIPNSVTKIGNTAFSENLLTSLTIGTGVTTIGNAAFANNQLTSVTIPSSVTSIGGGAFEINRLTSVTIPNSVITIGAIAFGCNRLTSIVIPNSVTTMGISTFAANDLTSVTIGTGLSVIPAMAFYNNELANVTIPANIESIDGDAFKDNDFTSVTIQGDPVTRFNYDWTDIGFDPAPMPE